MKKNIIPILFFFLFAIPVHADVVINELFPKTDPADYAYIELYNSGTDPVPLDRWKVENTANPTTSYILPASANIQPHGFFLLTHTQSAMTLSINGDTVKLTDVNGTIVDSKNYPGTLGYNTAMGRSSDGGGVWALCTKATPNAANICPEPSPTVTPTPFSTPTPARLPTETPIPTSTPIFVSPLPAGVLSHVSFGQLVGPDVLGESNTIMPTPLPAQKLPKFSDVIQFQISRITFIQILVVGVSWSMIAIVAIWRQRR